MRFAGRLAVLSGLILTLAYLGGCQTESAGVFISGETSPLRRSDGASAAWVGASVDDPPNMKAGGLVSGKTVWVSVGVVEPSVAEPVEIVDARAVTSDGVARTEVYVGRVGIDGGMGFWKPDSVPPVGDLHGLRGTPRLARGAVLDAEHEWIVYVAGELAPGEDHGSIRGAQLTVRDGDTERVMFVVQGAVLCAADIVVALAFAAPDDPWGCPNATTTVVPAPPTDPGLATLPG